MAVFNHNLVHRPLRGGIAIFNPVVNETGTIGLIATSNGNDRWIISCYHVLCRKDLSPAGDREPIFQPIDDQENLVGHTSLERADTVLDCASALIAPGILVTGETLNIPQISGIGEPKIGMRVLKSGSITGVTEGIIVALDGGDVVIDRPDSHPANAELSSPGDSGALWVARDTLQAVALHKSGSAFGGTTTTASKISAVLNQLKLRPVFT